LLIEPHAYQTDDFFVGEHFPESICSHDDKVALFGLNLCSGNDRFGSDVRRGL
jgi:hypothetical protein